MQSAYARPRSVTNITDINCQRCNNRNVTKSVPKARLADSREHWDTDALKRPFVSIFWFCKKQGAISHSSSEEVIQLDVGVRMKGMPASSRWEEVYFSFLLPAGRGNPSAARRGRSPHPATYLCCSAHIQNQRSCTTFNASA